MPRDPIPTSEPRRVGSGQLVVGGIVLIAAILAGITVWHHWSKGVASIAYWGAENGKNIRYAPLVQLEANGQTYHLSDAPGLVHFRQALIEDASFSGTLLSKEADADWTHQVMFSQPESVEATVVQFDLKQGLVRLKDADMVRIAKEEPTATGLRRFFADVTNANE